MGSVVVVILKCAESLSARGKGDNSDHVSQASPCVPGLETTPLYSASVSESPGKQDG